MKDRATSDFPAPTTSDRDTRITLRVTPGDDAGCVELGEVSKDTKGWWGGPWYDGAFGYFG